MLTNLSNLLRGKSGAIRNLILALPMTALLPPWRAGINDAAPATTRFGSIPKNGSPVYINSRPLTSPLEFANDTQTEGKSTTNKVVNLTGATSP